jgi:metallophosphoesterase (TIGR00282 family)
MNILYLGDVVGRSGRDALISQLPELRKRLALDFVVVNIENAAAGHGVTGKICDEVFAVGVDVLTTGNHVWDQKEIVPYMEREPRLLRPLNFQGRAPGRGSGLYTASSGKKVLVVLLMGRLYMDLLDCPFASLEQEMTRHRLGATADAVIIDIHAEASSEKMALGHMIDGQASLVVGSHTHIPTADAQILPKGTAYQSDAGMCGDYDSVIGMKKEIALTRFRHKGPNERLSPAEGEATLCGVFLVTDDRTGLAKRIEPIRLGGRLANHMPEVIG